MVNYLIFSLLFFYSCMAFCLEVRVEAQAQLLLSNNQKSHDISFTIDIINESPRDICLINYDFNREVKSFSGKFWQGFRMQLWSYEFDRGLEYSLKKSTKERLSWSNEFLTDEIIKAGARKQFVFKMGDFQTDFPEFISPIKDSIFKGNPGEVRFFILYRPLPTPKEIEKYENEDIDLPSITDQILECSCKFLIKRT